MERLNGWIWNGAFLNAFCEWKVAKLAKFARFSTRVDKKHFEKQNGMWVY